MCKESGASRASLSDLKVGRKQSLSAETLFKMNEILGEENQKVFTKVKKQIERSEIMNLDFTFLIEEQIFGDNKLKIFDEDEITMIPYGTKIYKILKKLGIYGKIL